MKTRLDKEGFQKYGGEFPFLNKFIVKKPYSGGGLTLLWKSEVKLEVINFTEHHILARVVKEDGLLGFLQNSMGGQM